jgi:hypothetical protein
MFAEKSYKWIEKEERINHEQKVVKIFISGKALLLIEITFID